MPPRQPTSWAGNSIHSGVETRFRIAHHLWHAAVDLAHHVKHQSSSRANGAPTDDHLHLFSGPIRCLVPAEQVNQTTSTFPSQNSRNPAFEAIVPNPFHYHGHLQVVWKLLPIPFNLSELPGFPTPSPVPACTIRGPRSSRAHCLPAISTPTETSLNGCA